MTRGTGAGTLVLVTGASGQIGSYVVEALAASGHRSRGVDQVPSAYAPVVADVRSEEAASALDGCTAVVHCAANVSVPRSVEAPMEDAAHNALGTVAMLEASRRRDVRTFVYVSSAAVYGAPQGVPIREDAALAPLSPYGQSKATGEGYVSLYGRLYGLQGHVVRPFNAFSARQRPDNPYSGVIARFLAAARRGQPLQVSGDGRQTRDFVAAEDVASFLALLATRPPASGPGVYNVGSGQERSILDLARHVSLAAGLPPPHHVPARPGEIPRSLADVTRARAVGFRPSTTVEDFLSRELRMPARSAP